MRLSHPLPALFIAAAIACAVGSAKAETAGKVDFAGKTITLVVGFGVGGSYDASARLAADHLGRFLPGHPTVIVENMSGGGGARAVAFLATAAPKDGTVVSIIPATVAFDSALGQLPPNVKADDFAYIGRVTSPASIVFTGDASPTKTIADAKMRETTMAASGAGASSSYLPRVANALLGTKFKVIEGYKGTADMALAMERGEVEGFTWNLDSIASSHPEWLGDEGLNIFFVTSVERSPRHPDTPALTELAENDEQRSLFALLAAEGDIGRSLVLPPGVSDDLIAAYRAAFDEMIRDPDFIAGAKQRGVPVDPASGEAVQKIVTTSMNVSPATIKVLADILKAGGG